ncbi:MAG: hypothetical protein HRU28_15275, partial [Rhizobiales bacterium]|nr:hypothetical protein [Hyphomicrobiales bacterium]
MDMKLMMVLEMIDKVTKPLSKIHKATKKFANAEAKSRLASQKSTQAAKAAERGQIKYAKSLNRSARALKAQAKALNFSKGMVGKASLYTNYGARFGSAFGKSFKKSALRFTIGAAIGIGLGVGIGKGFVNTAAKFEDFRAVLETLEGSSAKAKVSMDWVQEFAVKTPYELDKVVEGFVKLRSYGLDPTNGLLEVLGDTSAGMGKPLIDAVEAMADAVTGENERLKAFGVTTSVKGNAVTYKYTIDGVDKYAKVTKGNSAQIQKTLSKIFNLKFEGASDKLSTTWNGMMGNVSDQWTKFQNMVMASGLFDWMKGKLTNILAQLDKWEASGELAAWAKSTGESIKTFLIGTYEFFVELKNIGSEVWPVIQQIGSAFKTAADALGGWDKLAYVVIGLNFLGSFVAVAGIILSIGAAFLSAAVGASAFAMALLANPITWVVLAIVAAVAAIVYAAYQLNQNWDAVIAWFGNAWEWVKGRWNSFTEWLSGFWNDILSMATAKINDIKSAFDVGLIAGLTEIFTSFSPVSLFIKAIDAIFSYFTGISLIDEGSKFVASLIEGFKQWDMLNWFVEKFTKIYKIIGNK